MTKATATQVSASLSSSTSLAIVSSALECSGDRGIDLAAAGRVAGQPFDDGRGGLGRDLLYVRHGRCPAVVDRLLGRRDAGIESGVELLARGFRGRGLPRPGLVGKHLRTGARVGERLLVGG